MGKVGEGTKIAPDAILGTDVVIGNNVTICSGCIVGKGVLIEDNTVIKERCIILDNVTIGKNCRIDYGVIIRENVCIGSDSYIGTQCILGELLAYQIENGVQTEKLVVDKGAVIRSNSILYGGSAIGNHFQTGHHVTIREGADIGNHVSVGTLSDIQGNCKLGNYVRMHSNVHIGQLSEIDDYVWLFPYVVLTNDPTPPSEDFLGVHICSFAIIATGAILMPGVVIGGDSLVGAGAIVTKSVDEYTVVAGNPAKKISDVRNIKSKVTGESVYPWRYHFKRGMPWEDSDFEQWYYGVKKVTELDKDS